PIFIVGFNAVIGSWNITEMSAPRIFRMSLSFSCNKSRPSNQISPRSMNALSLGNKRVMAFDVTDLPEPDSPTIANVFPFSKERSTPRTAYTLPAYVLKETWRFFMVNILFMLCLLLFIVSLTIPIRASLDRVHPANHHLTG